MDAELFIASKSHPGETYRMVRGARGAWEHDGETGRTCEAWTFNRHCHHQDEAEAAEPTRAVAVMDDDPLALVRQIDVRTIIGGALSDPGKNPDGSHPWGYSFRIGSKMVEGVTSDAVQDACRALAFVGETIRCEDVYIEREDDRYCFLKAKAVRYAVSPGAADVKLDGTIRGKRIPKFMTFKDGREVPDDKWWEKGCTEAARNACEALLPTELVNQIKSLALGAGRVSNSQSTSERQEGPRAPESPSSEQARGVNHAQRQAHDRNFGSYGPDGGPHPDSRTAAEKIEMWRDMAFISLRNDPEGWDWFSGILVNREVHRGYRALADACGMSTIETDALKDTIDGIAVGDLLDGIDSRQLARIGRSNDAK